MTELPICPSCQTSVSEHRKSLKCDGMCKKTYHTSCIRWSSEEYQSYVTISNKVKWFCPSCVNSLERVFVRESTFDLQSIDSKNSLRNGEKTSMDKICSFALDDDVMHKMKSIDCLDWICNEKNCIVNKHQRAKGKPNMQEQHKQTFVRDIINQREVRSKPMTPSSLDFYQKSAKVYDNDKSSTNQFHLSPPLWQYQKPIYSNYNDINNAQNSYPNDVTKVQCNSEKPNTSQTGVNPIHIVHNERQRDEIWKKSVNKLHALSFLSRGRKPKSKKSLAMERKLNKKEVGNSKEKELGLQHLTTDSGESLILHITYMRKKDRYKKSVSNPFLKKNKHSKEKDIKIKDSKYGIHLERNGLTNMKNEKIVKHISTDSGEAFLLHTIKSNRQGDEFVESIQFLEDAEMDKDQNPMCNSILQGKTLCTSHNKGSPSKKRNDAVKCISPIISGESLENLSPAVMYIDKKQMKNDPEENTENTNSPEAFDGTVLQNNPRSMKNAQLNPWEENFENIQTLFQRKQLNEMSVLSDKNINLLKAVKDYTEQNNISQNGNIFASMKPEDQDLVEEIIENISHTLENMNQTEKLKIEEIEGSTPTIEQARSTQSYITQYKNFINSGNDRDTTNELRLSNSALLRKSNSDKLLYDLYNFGSKENTRKNIKTEKNELNREISYGNGQNKSEVNSSFHFIPLQDGKDITKSNTSNLTNKSSRNSKSSFKNINSSNINKRKDKTEDDTMLNCNPVKVDVPSKMKTSYSDQTLKCSENMCKKKSKPQNDPDLGYLESLISLISNMISHKIKKQDEETQVDLSEWTSFENAVTQTCPIKIPRSTIAINTSCSMSLLKDEVCQCPEICLQENTGRTKIQELKNTFLKLEQFSKKNKPDLSKSNLDKTFKPTVTFSDTPNISRELKQHKVQEWLFTARQDQLNNPKQVKPNIFKVTNRKTLLEKNKFIFEGALTGQPIKEEAVANSNHVS